MIPKIIHYCWFGPKQIPEKISEYIETWKKFCPDFEIMLWNEDNFDVNLFKVSELAYQAKKYAFVADVCRIYALEKFGGIYLDTDMQLIKPIDDLLYHPAFVGFEDDDFAAAGIIGAESKNPFIIDVLGYYEEIENINFNSMEIYDFTIPIIFTKILKEKFSLISKINNDLPNYCFIYKEDYFYPKNYHTGLTNITLNTYAIHHYDASWIDDKQQHLDNQKYQRLNFYTKKIQEDSITFEEAFSKLRVVYKMSKLDIVRYFVKKVFKSS